MIWGMRYVVIALVVLAIVALNVWAFWWDCSGRYWAKNRFAPPREY